MTSYTDGFLHNYFLNNAKKRLHKWIHYFDIYERHFSRFRNNKPVVVEIGVCGGGSLLMWREYFGVGCQIVGIDIDPTCTNHQSECIDVVIGSQDDPNVIQSVINKYGNPDIVIDDGSHVMSHVIKTFDLMYPCTSSNGVYLVEDMHTAYWPEYGGGLCREGTFIELCKSLIDQINACHTKGAVPVLDFCKTTDSISFYDSVVVFEKRPQGKRQAPITDSM